MDFCDGSQSGSSYAFEAESEIGVNRYVRETLKAMRMSVRQGNLMSSQKLKAVVVNKVELNQEVNLDETNDAILDMMEEDEMPDVIIGSDLSASDEEE